MAVTAVVARVMCTAIVKCFRSLACLWRRRPGTGSLLFSSETGEGESSSACVCVCVRDCI